MLGIVHYPRGEYRVRIQFFRLAGHHPGARFEIFLMDTRARRHARNASIAPIHKEQGKR